MGGTSRKTVVTGEELLAYREKLKTDTARCRVPTSRRKRKLGSKNGKK